MSSAVAHLRTTEWAVLHELARTTLRNEGFARIGTPLMKRVDTRVFQISDVLAHGMATEQVLRQKMGLTWRLSYMRLID